jgi:hypothetical protein
VIWCPSPFRSFRTTSRLCQFCITYRTKLPPLITITCWRLRFPVAECLLRWETTDLPGRANGRCRLCRRDSNSDLNVVTLTLLITRRIIRPVTSHHLTIPLLSVAENHRRYLASRLNTCKQISRERKQTNRRRRRRKQCEKLFQMSPKLYGCSNINDKYNRHIIIIFSVFSRAKKKTKKNKKDI